jgi:hypothetical protein
MATATRNGTAGDVPTKPSTRVDISQVPETLKRLRSWTPWKLVFRNGKWTKVPCNGRGVNTKPQTDPADRMTFEEAVEAYTAGGGKFGIAMVCGDGIGMVDLDDAIDAEGSIKPEAQKIVDDLPGHWERSPSRRGLRCVFRGVKPGPRCRRDSEPLSDGTKFEIYTADRLFTITGDVVRTGPLVDASAAIADLYHQWFPPKPQPTPSPRAKISPDVDDAAILAKARAAANGAKFSALYDHGDTSLYNGDDSAADLALVSMLLFWFAGDVDRVKRAFLASALGQRGKCQDRPDYIDRTIDAAASSMTEVYSSASVLPFRVPETLPGSRSAPSGGTPEPETAEAPDGIPSDPEHSPAGVSGTSRRFDNFCLEAVPDGDGVRYVRAPLRMAELVAQVDAIAPGWPCTVGRERQLFVADGDKVTVLGSAAQLLAWLDGRARVEWARGAAYITQDRFFEHLRMCATHYEGLEHAPHWPRLPGVYYAHRDIPRPTRRALGAFLAKFRPASDVDASLLMAFLLTLFWGGRPGSRPAFLIAGPEGDAQRGRAVGKSTLVAMFSRLASRMFDVSSREEWSKVMDRLLSDSARDVRLVRIDNVKTSRLSWAELEGAITAPEITGRKMYVGDGARPNTLTWAITGNGLTLSKDLASRIVVIRLNRHDNSPEWEAELVDYIEANRWEILADIGDILTGPAGDLRAATRWAAWEMGVLSRVHNPAACQAAIVERQKGYDDDDAEQDAIADYFRDRLQEVGHPPATAVVKIKPIRVAEWLSVVMGTRIAANRASNLLAQAQVPELRQCRTRDERYWLWRGHEAAGDNNRPDDFEELHAEWAEKQQVEKAETWARAQQKARGGSYSAWSQTA